MSELTYLEKLLDGVKVEWQTLGKVLKRTKGTKITAGQMKALHKDNAPLKIFAGGKTVAFVDFKDIPEKDINREPSIIVKSRGIIEFEYYDKPFSHKNEMWSYHSNNDAISIKYIYYFLKINEGYFQKIGGKMQMPQIATPDTDKFEVPIPCPDNPEKSLAIQSEIVRILDKFTALTAELTAELNMRKKQYNYYRDQLLSFKEGEVEWKTLGEVAVIGTGNHDTQDAIEHGKYIFYARGREPLKLNVFDFDETAIITAGDGAGVGKVFHYAKGKYALHQRAYRIVPNAFMNPRFVYHYITAYFFTYIQKASVSSSVTSLRRPMFLKFPIPVPPSEEQARIVEILDKFDTLTNSITEGLPREIELRQKQYEYYRDLLFSFPKPETVSN
ncbi:restriction endonuclease subunit S [Escherichia coli]|uniref:Restriction endonuclease subunit S n=1 Tax=Escherichia coli TaxID=562 RepID=A0A827EUV8_ECOLX|nr:restriction endonuclease subunit S [Escherichia coli]MCC1736610.1 restriction endonuclease subunit S [Salmonella enterica subsp. enterica serovar Indiana]EEW1477468.1 restriction endonuclease subunit S [Escherichia coli]EFA4593116.1 restriction endonuclease subunit S [Escherichia coli]EFC1505115.1 restriction endonuclease subunit S [Escherichia coli]EFE9629202.1 restriction endonuclease subunit S [Escherichia coli]